MAQNFFDTVWSDEKSLAFTRWLVLGIGAVCVGMAACGPRIIRWLMHERDLNVSGPAVGAGLLVLGYCCAALALWMLYNLYTFLRRLEHNEVFVPANVTALRRISWCCTLAGALCLPTGFIVYLPFAFLGCAALFMALIVRVIKNAFAQAVNMKNELDLTI